MILRIKNNIVCVNGRLMWDFASFYYLYLSIIQTHNYYVEKS